ncbi:MAG TPA: hypothetical protein VF446_13685 [Trinickia sp.]
MNAPHRPLPSFAALPRRVASAAVCATALATLSSCVVAPPPGPILSRLAPGEPGAAESARPLTDAEKKRYDEIDKQVLREQNEAMSARAWARYYTPYYYPAPVTFGGYYGGWNSGWGVGYTSPGYYPGWWW